MKDKCVTCDNKSLYDKEDDFTITVKNTKTKQKKQKV